MKNNARKWTKEEEEYLSCNYGHLTLSYIAKKLNRSESSILNKRQKLGLGAYLENGDYITFNKLISALGMKNDIGYKNISWIENRGLPIMKKKVKKSSFKVINLDEFWKWAEKNQQFLDFSNFEKHSLGAEPDWVAKKRYYDVQYKLNVNNKPWTQKEDEYLKFLLNQYQYTIKEISQKMCRSESAIQRRIHDLKLRQRPVKADNHTFWTDEEYEILKEMILQGANYENISLKLDKRGSKAIRGLVYRLYGTEVLDKVRTVIKQEGEIRKHKMTRRNI